MRWFLFVVGLLLIASALLDVFRTLFHPARHGNVSEALILGNWRLFRRAFPSLLSTAGPLNLVIVISFWMASVVLGFALLYWIAIPAQIIVSPGMDKSYFTSFATAINLSMASLITVTLGLETNSSLLQFAMSAEAVVGFAILTASISWILSIYPVIEHRRSLAHEISLLHFSEYRGLRRAEQLQDSDFHTLLLGFAAQIATIRTELNQFPITYYFQENEDRSALAPNLFYLAELTEEVSREREYCRLAATVLGGAIDDLLEMVRTKYLGSVHGDRWRILEAMNDDHFRQPLHREPAPLN